MTPAEWDEHRWRWCDRCCHLRRCPVQDIMMAHPDDPACNVLLRGGRCSQFEPQRESIRITSRGRGR